MNQRFQLEPAYLLHRRPWSESSLLLEVFSRDHGRVGMIARGARRARSKWQGILQPFQPMLISWSARGELGTLTGAERIHSSGGLKGITLFCGFYINELIVRLCVRNDAHPGAFQAYTECLETLRSGHEPQAALRAFEKALLQEIGFEMQLRYDTRNKRAVEAAGTYRYDPESGPVAQAPGAAHRTYPGAVFLALADDNYSDPRLMPSMRRLLQGAMAHQLGGKPLASQQVLRAMLR